MAKKAPAQNTEKPPAPGKPFVKGDERINKGGRPKGQMTLVKELLKLGPKALENLKRALDENERWATELVVGAFTIKELIAAALSERDDDGEGFDWDAVGEAKFQKVISILREPKPEDEA